MGIRVRKAIGYGASINEENFSERLDGIKIKVSTLMKRRYTEMKRKEITGYISLSFEMKHKSVRSNSYHGKYPESVYDLIHYAEYPDEPNGMWLFSTPTTYKNWIRHDDAIDYCDATMNTVDCETQVKHLKGGLYPYLGLMREDTGELVEHPVSTILFKQHFPDIKTAPVVPEAIRVLCEHIKPEGDPKFWLKLRPMLITWWS